MKTITLSEFRKDIKKYYNIADDGEQVLVNRRSGEAFLLYLLNRLKFNL